MPVLYLFNQGTIHIVVGGGGAILGWIPQFILETETSHIFGVAMQNPKKISLHSIIYTCIIKH